MYFSGSCGRGPSINDVHISGEEGGSRNADISNKGHCTKFGHEGGGPKTGRKFGHHL